MIAIFTGLRPRPTSWILPSGPTAVWRIVWRRWRWTV